MLISRSNQKAGLKFLLRCIVRVLPLVVACIAVCLLMPRVLDGR